jgi:hypothetical protein
MVVIEGGGGKGMYFKIGLDCINMGVVSVLVFCGKLMVGMC